MASSDPEVVAAKPAKVQTKAATVEQQPIPDLLALQSKTEGDAAVEGNTKTRGLRFNKFSHRSTTG